MAKARKGGFLTLPVGGAIVYITNAERRTPPTPLPTTTPFFLYIFSPGVSPLPASAGELKPRKSSLGLVLKLQATLEPNGSVDARDVPRGLGVVLDEFHVLVAGRVCGERGSLLLGQAQDFIAQPIRVADGHEGLWSTSPVSPCSNRRLGVKPGASGHTSFL